jgi:hypothetical protein
LGVDWKKIVNFFACWPLTFFFFFFFFFSQPWPPYYPPS